MSLFNELKRRNVFRVGLAYMVSAWIIAQVAGLVLDSIEAPAWVMQALLLMLGLGFIVALIIAWAYELTPEGIKKEKDVVRDESVTNITAKKLDYITLVAALGVLGMFVYQQMNSATTVIPAQTESQSVITDTAKDSMDSEKEGKPSVNNKSIAVLPFTNMANNPDNEPFTLGLHDDLLTHLSKISALKVISRTSVMEYKDTTKKIKDIAKELGVANILEGGVQRAGNQIRLNVQLIDAKTDEHLWAEIYDRELTTQNIFQIQTEISKAIAAALKAQLTPAEYKSIASVATDNLEAYNAYLAARQLLEKRESASLKQALVLFKKATQLDPNYALAYVGQASVYVHLTSYSDLSLAEMNKLSEPLIARALELEPLLAAAHRVKAQYLSNNQLYEEAEKKYQYTLSLNSNDAQTYHFYAFMLRKTGRIKEALLMQRKAAELDPLSNVILNNVGWSLLLNGQTQAALQQFQSIQKLNPNYPGAYDGLAWSNVVLGNHSQAIIQQNKSVALAPNFIQGRFWLFSSYLNIGDASAARAELEKARGLSPDFGSYTYQESLLDVLSGNYKAAQQRFVEAIEREPENKNHKQNLALFSLFNGDCQLALKMWQQTDPAMFNTDALINRVNVDKAINSAWCLIQIQTDQAQTANHLIKKAQDYIILNPQNNLQTSFTQTIILAIQGKTKQAATEYAKNITSNNTRGWFRIDHYPYFVEMRKSSIYINAHKQLMQNLAQQRELLADYRKKENKQ